MNFNYFHQLPQNILGKLISINSKEVYYTMNDGVTKIIYFKKNFFKSAVSLGNYIILDELYEKLDIKRISRSVNHEYGHCKQSEILGWLYLLAVGIPSISRNIFDRIFHKKWEYAKRELWYYGGYPEKWADELGGISNER